MDYKKHFGENAKQVRIDAHAVAESYEDVALDLGLELEDVAAAIASLATSFGGCVGCRYSRAPTPRVDGPWRRARLQLTARGCVLGLMQDNCIAFEPIVPQP